MEKNCKSRLLKRLDELEARVAELEKHSHPPVNLVPIIQDEIEYQLAKKLC
jgi:hypothetical protein